MSKEVLSRMATQTIRLRLGDCMKVIADFPADSFEAIVCDPPYG